MERIGKPFDLSGNVAVVTGAARGIGRAAATALAAAGADIAGVDIAGPVSPTLDYAPVSEEYLAETGRAVVALRRPWMACRLDQRDFGGLRDAATRTERDFGRIDILFANAGIQPFKPILDMDDAPTRSPPVTVRRARVDQYSTPANAQKRSVYFRDGVRHLRNNTRPVPFQRCL